jgi:hypothetical protein
MKNRTAARRAGVERTVKDSLSFLQRGCGERILKEEVRR